MKNVFSVILVMFFLNVFSQNTDNVTNIEESGRIIIKQNSDIKGNDYLYDEWNNGMIVLDDSIFSKQDYLKYDVYKDRVIIKNMKNLDELIEITDKALTSFSIIEKENNIKHDFVKLYKRNFAGEAEDGFYELVFNKQKSNYFIKKNSKIIYDPNRSKGTQAINNYQLEYQDKVNYYIKDDSGIYVNVKLKKKNINSILTKHAALMEAFVKTNKINFNKESDVMNLVNYYYSL